MCVNIDLGMGKTNEAVPAIIISFDLIRAFQGYSFWSVGVVLKRTGVFSRCTGCCLVSGHGWTDCLPTNPTIETMILICRKYQPFTVVKLKLSWVVVD